MARKIKNIIVSLKINESRDMDVRIVAEGDDNSYSYGDISDQLTNGQKNSLISICNNIISKLEK
jgi:hypothetical protein